MNEMAGKIVTACSNKIRSGTTMCLKLFGKNLKTSIATCFALFASAFCEIAVAQSVPDDGSCNQLNDSIFSRSLSGSSLVEGLPIYATANSSRPLNISRELKFHDRLRLGKTTSSKVLIKTEDEAVCGWADISLVASRDDDPLLIRDIADAGPEMRMRVNGKIIENPLVAKALLRSDLLDEDRSVDRDAVMVQLYKSPLDTKRKGDRLGVFTIHSIYKAHQTEAGKWYYISGNSSMTAASSGWVRAENIFLWPTQMALYFSPKPIPAYIFPDEKSAARGRVTDDLLWLGERPDWDGDMGERTIARYPILENRSPERSGKRILQVAFFANRAFLDGQGTEIESRELMRQTSELAQIATEIKNADILFVIDNTQSMQAYFDPVVRAVQEAMNVISSDKNFDSKYRFSAAVYGDYKDKTANRANMEFRLVQSFTSQPERLSKLTRLPVYRDPLGDGPEASRAGILRAIEEAKFNNTDERNKFVIWISDYGSRRYGRTETLRDRDVAQELKKQGIIFKAIGVRGAASQNGARSFMEQANNIAAGIGEGSLNPTNLTRPGTSLTETTKQVKSAIIDLFSESNRVSAAIDSAGTTLDSEREQALKRLPSANIAMRKAILQSKGYTLEQIEAVFLSGQLMQTGYVNYEPERKNFELWVNMPYDDAVLFGSSMRRICKGMRGGNVESDLRDALLGITEAFSGDAYSSSESLNEFLARAFFLPVEHYPPMFNMTLPELVKEWDEASESPDAIFQMAGPLCKSGRLFDYVGRGEYIDPKNLASTDGYYWEPKEGAEVRSFEWRWRQRNQNNYVYLPANYFPGKVDQAR